jgi:hypothetical protein
MKPGSGDFDKNRDCVGWHFGYIPGLANILKED